MYIVTMIQKFCLNSPVLFITDSPQGTKNPSTVFALNMRYLSGNCINIKEFYEVRTKRFFLIQFSSRN